MVRGMAATPETGFLVLADLTGYTAYLSRGELEHAPAIAGDLLETIVGRLEPPFRLAKLEGDAAFLFVEDGRAEPALLVDAVQACYAAFRRRLRSIEQASSCDCNACSQAPRLDLKFFVHHGSYVRSRIAGRDELAGPSIIVVHRLLKGAGRAAVEQTDGGAFGFALFTADAIAALGFEPGSADLIAGSESLEHLGEVTTYTLDLESRWQAETSRQRLVFEDGAAAIEVGIEVAASAAETWAHLTAPALRTSWEGPLEIRESGGDGWRGVGTTSVCVTGRLATLEEVVDWQPYEHVGYRLAVPGIGPVEATYDLDSEGDRTVVRLRWAPIGEPGSEPDAIEAVRRDKEAALGRLARLLGAREAVEVPA
jgi:hypothetical protein